MVLTTNARLTLLSKLIFVGMFILTSILFASNSKQVYASSCGIDYHANYTCKNGTYLEIWPDPTCPGAAKVNAYLDRVYLYDTPLSHKYMGSAGQSPECTPLSSNCPSYCN